MPSRWLQIAKADKLKPLEVELKKLEDLSDAVLKDFTYMRAREEEMRDTNGQGFRPELRNVSIYQLLCFLSLPFFFVKIVITKTPQNSIVVTLKPVW